MAAVELEPLTPGNVRAVCELRLAPGQERFVAPNAVSIAEAYVHPQAWCRAVRSGGRLVGFVMLWDSAEEPGYMLWRLMVDAAAQGRGISRRVVALVAGHVRAQGATVLKVSARNGSGSPAPFYLALGFVPTGEMADEDEPVYALDL
ncbi:diamine N-acetyltransferase [Geodermatophilus bullaregiensis]|uniref:GNAT family N-acetyltransferase n=1 Tax=Geodermatophilus bullaregiensis TaxID=1564160 RepID=UPI0019580499|nr:GNAT family N-acetyltransferase [Geodermatophilus bullaregiensis]MBM7806710.1 diamine N-acetyltransferase [Geodermatophilus bullaregiensis]